MKEIQVPIVQFRLPDLPHIRSIKFTEQYLIIDMVLFGPKIGNLRKWVSLNSETYIRILSSGGKLSLIKAEGIPVKPAALEYRNKRKSLLFKLYFPLPPEDTEFVDLIEDENEKKGCCNLYGICLSQAAEQNVKHYWKIVSSIAEIPGD